MKPIFPLFLSAMLSCTCLGRDPGLGGQVYSNPNGHLVEPPGTRINFRPGTLTNPISYAIKSVTSHESVFVAVASEHFFHLSTAPTGRGAVLVSADGKNWRIPHTSEQGLHAVASNAGRLVATADGGNLLISSDGEDWASASSGGSDTLREVTYGNGLWVAVGDRGSIVTSPDTMNWTILKDPARSRYHLIAVAFGGGRFVAVGADHLGHAFASSDGANWSHTKLPDLSYIPAGIVFGNGRFLTTGGDGRVDVSTDGVNWTRTTPRDSNWNAQSVAYAHGRFLVPFRDGVLSSRDGTKWVRDFLRSGTERIRGLAYRNGTYVAVGLDGLIMYAEGSEPYLDQIEKRDGSIGISFSGGTKPSYAVVAASSLDPGSWNRIGEVLTTDGVGVLQDANAPQLAQRFYRVVPSRSTPSPTH